MSCLDPVGPARLSKTWREERAVDRFLVSKGVVLESPAITGEVPEQQLPETRVTENQSEAIVKRSSALGVKRSRLLGSFLALALTVSAN